MEELSEVLIWAILIGLIPGFIAKTKGYSFFSWWKYGALLFIIAIIHVFLIPNKKNIEQKVLNELEKYKKLLKEGIISEEEFQLKKEELKKNFTSIIKEE